MAKTRSTKRSAGLDVGERRIGVAVSDSLALTAQPLGVVQRTSAQAAIEGIMSLLRDYDVAAFVVGLPLNMDGREGPQADRVRHFCSKLEAQTGIGVLFQDERLTTVQGERVLIEAGLQRRKRRATVDATAAVLILQGHLDARGGNR